MPVLRSPNPFRRVTTLKDSPGEWLDQNRHRVTFNGAVVPLCDLLDANEDSGILCTLKRCPDGKLFYRDGDTVTIIQRGHIRITDIAQVVVRQPEEVAFEP